MLDKLFFRRNTLCIARENGAAQREKVRRPGALAVFGCTLTRGGAEAVRTLRMKMVMIMVILILALMTVILALSGRLDRLSAVDGSKL